MKKKLLVCLALIASCGFHLGAQAPQISSGTTEYWYLIQATRPAGPTYLTSQGAGKQTSSSVIGDIDSQLWKFVTLGEGVAMINKSTGEYLDADAAADARVSTKATLPIQALGLRESLTEVNSVFRFWIENYGADSQVATFRLHAGANANPMNWTGNATDNSDWLIQECTTDLLKASYISLIAEDRAAYDASKVGVLFGQFPTSARTAFNDIIAAEEAKDPNSLTLDQLLTGMKTLRDALSNFKTLVSRDVNMLVSTTQFPAWFYIRGNNSTGVSAYGKVLTKSDDKVICADKVDDSDDQLWRFEKNTTDNTMKIINKTALEEMKGGAESAQILLVADASGSKFTPSAHPDGLSAKILFNEGKDEYLHGDGSRNLVGWNDSANPNSAWTFDFASGTNPSLNGYINSLIQKRFKYEYTEEGTHYGQFPAAARTAFDELLATEEAKEPSSMTDEELAASLVILNDGLTAYMLACNTNPDGTPAQWYTIESVKSPGKYLTVNPATMAMTLTTKDNTANQLFRFKTKEMGFDIICNSKQEGTIRCQSDAWDIVYNTGLDFPGGGGHDFVEMGYFPWMPTLFYGPNGTQVQLISFSGDPITSPDGAVIANSWDNMAYDGQSMWKLKFVKEEAASTAALTASTASNVIAFAKNKMIVVNGATAPVKVFTVSGIAVDATKTVNAGVYIIKTGSQTLKVTVQ